MRLLYILLFISSSMNLSAQITVLKDKKGQIGDVRIDYKITDIELTNDLEYTFNAVSEYKDAPIGFRFKIEEKWKAECFLDPSQYHKNNIRIESIGERSDNLRKVLNNLFKGTVFHSEEEPEHVLGLFSTIPRTTNVKPNFVCIFEFLPYNLPLNNEGEIIGGSCFRMIAVIDIPMKRMSVYYTLNPSCTTPALNARWDWLHKNSKETVECRKRCCPKR